MYVEALIAGLDDKSRLNMVAQSVVLDQLRRIDRAQRDAALLMASLARIAHIRHLIEVAFER